MADKIYEDNRVYWIWLTMIFGIGIETFWKYCRDYSRIKDFAEDVRNGKVKFKNANQNKRVEKIVYEDAAGILEKCLSHGVEVITANSRRYPKKLKRAVYPPPVLYYKGDISVISDMPAVAVIGTRNPCDYSLQITDSICSGLAKSNILTISGFEEGIDRRANAAAIIGEGKTAAVCGKGIFDPMVFEPEGELISENGVLVAEFTDTEDFGRIQYDKRNRILCGLSDALLFIEASDISHGLNNVKHAENLKLPVFAVPPADVNDRHFFGQRDLLRNGAYAAFEAQDIARYMSRMIDEDSGGMVKYENIKLVKDSRVTDRGKKAGGKGKNIEKKAAEGLHKSENSAKINISELEGRQKDIAELLKSEGATHIDSIAEKLDIPVYEAINEIIGMQLDGIVNELPGKIYELA